MLVEVYPSPYIYDGYTKQAYIAPLHNMWQAVRFSFRPMLIQETTAVTNDLAKRKEPDKAASYQALLLEKKVIEWDIKDQKGFALEKTHTNILRLQPMMIYRMLSIVMGEDGGDVDPESTGEVAALDAETDLQRALSGTQGITISHEEVDAKN